ncbi:D-alanyl-D-alanine carboxypeptidase family protein [filamentous cyanobacterium LEGE 11480]|uniref:D-alanyl-D-alanine carboxypeptidase family protein n=2 Tax=Romeriopsis TaxID=2992131 RepID=A0A928Z4R8_9CYAN|nr:D-alanyl-D-alanine carboxypeptidase family protein [Romeriopsis navalis LEGE 11480]
MAWFGITAIGLLIGGIGILTLSRLASAPASNAAKVLTSKPASKAELAKAKPAPDGRVLNHYPYKEAAQGNLDPVTADNSIQLHYKAAKAYKQMAADARVDGVLLVPLSGFRSTQIQEDLFFNVSRERNQRPQERASVSAPPGHSEHHTGYAMDIGDANVPAVNLSQNFESTAAFRWLQANAARYSFELSFPKGNEQGVSYEPWHWRFVGDSESLATFYKAREVKPQAN